MKLLHCTVCGDVVALRADFRSCHCGKSYGRYLEDHHHIVYGGPYSVIIGLANCDITESLLHPEDPAIRAWVMNNNHPRTRSVSSIQEAKEASVFPEEGKPNEHREGDGS
jgi:hypothetical protein